MIDEYITPREATRILGVHAQSLRRWEKEGKIKAYRTPGGQRRFLRTEIEKFSGRERSIRTVCYARVSTSSQRDDLIRQSEYLSERYPEAECICEVGSGLNFKRKKLLSLLQRVMQHDIQRIIVAHPDRLCRFGFELVRWICEQNECELVVLETVNSHQSKNSWQICCPSSIVSLLGFTDSENIAEKSARSYGKNPFKTRQHLTPNSVVKIPVFPCELHKTWKQWLAAYRWVQPMHQFFNSGFVLPKGLSLDQQIQSLQQISENEWTKCLGKTRQEAVCEAEQARKQAKKAWLAKPKGERGSSK